MFFVHRDLHVELTLSYLPSSCSKQLVDRSALLIC